MIPNSVAKVCKALGISHAKIVDLYDKIITDGADKDDVKKLMFLMAKVGMELFKQAQQDVFDKMFGEPERN